LTSLYLQIKFKNMEDIYFVESVPSSGPTENCHWANIVIKRLVVSLFSQTLSHLRGFPGSSLRILAAARTDYAINTYTTLFAKWQQYKNNKQLN